MKLEFNICKISEESRIYKMLSKKENFINEFIAVGEETTKNGEHYILIHPIDKEKGLVLVGGISIDELALGIKREDISLKNDCIGAVDCAEFDIPKKYLSVKSFDNIIKINDLEDENNIFRK